MSQAEKLYFERLSNLKIGPMNFCFYMHIHIEPPMILRDFQSPTPCYWPTVAPRTQGTPRIFAIFTLFRRRWGDFAVGELETCGFLYPTQNCMPILKMYRLFGFGPTLYLPEPIMRENWQKTNFL